MAVAEVDLLTGEMQQEFGKLSIWDPVSIGRLERLFSLTSQMWMALERVPRRLHGPIAVAASPGQRRHV
jgi:hypothetical protein